MRASGATLPRPPRYAPVNTGARPGKRNERGYRDEDHGLKKAPGTRRLVCLGDSFAWGAGVQFEDTYPQRLRRLLRKRGDAWEIVNLALPGLNTVDEAARLEAEGLAYDPDVVLLGYVLNDAEGPRGPELQRALDWSRSTESNHSPVRSALYDFLRRRLWCTYEDWRYVRDFRSMYAPGAPGWIAGQRALLAMGELCQGRGRPFVVAVFPLFGGPLDDRYPFSDIHREVGSAARAAGATVVDLLPSFRGLNWEALVVDADNDEHPNEVAHRIAAGTIAQTIRQVYGASEVDEVPTHR